MNHLYTVSTKEALLNTSIFPIARGHFLLTLLKSFCKLLGLPALLLLLTALLSLPANSQTGLQFNGTNRYVTSGVTPANSILNTPVFTVETWFMRTGTGTTVSTGTGGLPAVIPLVTKGTSEAETGPADINYFLGINTTGNVLCADFEEAQTSASPGLNHPISGITAIVNNVWYHAAATYNGTRWQLFLNGNLEAELTVGRTANAAVISPFAMASSIRSNGTTIQGYFNGVLDEVRLWNYARTQVEIQASMNAEVNSGTGLLGRWGLNEGAGTSAVNSIAGSPAGTLINTPGWVCGAPALDMTITAPSGLTATASSAFQINLGWTDNSGNETNFEIERSTTGIGGTYSLLATVNANTNSYSDVTATALNEYCYRVRAKNCTVNSGYTGSTCATTPAEGNYALDLGSAGAYITFGQAMGLSTQNFTIETWFKRTGTGTANTTGTGGINIIPLIAKGSQEADGSNVDANYILGIQSATNVIAADFEEGTGSTSTGLNHPITGTTIITDNVWHHAAATFENGVFKIYLDGVLEASVNLSSSVFPQGASIQHAALGTMINSTGTTFGKFQGLLDEARIWNYERTEAQLRSTINTQITTSQSGLLARWGLNEGSGTTVNGSAGTAFTGTITGTGWNWITPGSPFNITFNTPTTLSLQDGVNSYIGTRDTYTYDVSPGTVRGSETTFIQDKNATDDRVSLLRFDLSSIPAGSTIQSATLQFYVDVEGQGFNMYRMLVPWDEATVTFTSIGNRHFAANNTDAESAINTNWPGVDGYTGLITVSVPASTIQNWIDGTLTNNGWLMIATHADDGQQLRSREYGTAGDRPKLTVTYVNSSTNLPPDLPTNPSPANNAASPSTSPTLCTTVSDADNTNLEVRFYGRKKTSSGAKFTIVGLPDTQFYTEEVQGTNSSGGGHNGIFKSQTQWIADHRIDSSIAFVVQLGDCVQNGDNPPGADDQIEWKRADTSMKKIEFPNVPVIDGIPYGICVGNHDQGTIGNPDLPSNNYNSFFGSSRFTGRAYYGGHYGTDNDNHYELFTAGGIDFIHISIEYYPNGTTASLQPVLDWADALLKTYPNRKGILSSHNLLTTGNPANFQGPGQKIYTDLKDNPNLILMLAGHVAGEGRRTDVFNGNTIHTIMADYQSGYSNGGNGYLRIMQFLPAQNLLNIRTYSPYSNTSLTGSGSQFSLPVNLSEAFTLIGTNSNVAAGSETCIQWPSLEQFTEYEWYVEVTDGVNTTTGPVWTFTTPANSPLPVNIISFKASAENNDKVKLTWTTTYERDNSHFEIQRSTNGMYYTSIGTVPGRNNSNSLQEYTFYDNLPIKGISFYRLKQVDNDARLTYSKVERVNITDPKTRVEVFPNPVSGNNFTIKLINDINGTVDVRVFDMRGRLHLQQQHSNSNFITINHHLAPGLYTIKVTTNEMTEVKKIIVH